MHVSCSGFIDGVRKLWHIADICCSILYCSTGFICLTHLQRYVAAAEDVTLEGKSMETLARVSNGDLRKAITTLQSAVRLQGPRVAPQTLLDVAGAIPESAVQSVMRACATSSFQAVQDAVTDVIADGYGVRSSERQTLPLLD